MSQLAKIWCRVMVVIHMVFTWQFHTFLIFVYDILCVPLFRYGHVFLWDSGSSVGEISGHSKFINAIDYRPTRPFRVVTAGEDKHVCWFEGPPFRYKNKLSVSQVEAKLTWWCFWLVTLRGIELVKNVKVPYGL